MVLNRAALLAVLALVACRRESGSPLARLAPYAGAWRCPMNHLTADDERARHVTQDVTIALEPGRARYAVRFAPDPDAPSPEAVTSVAYWSYDRAAQHFTSEANVGEGQTAVEERYSSPGPESGTLVWTGELHSEISAPIRMTFTRAPAELDLVVEAFAEGAWRPLSTATCTPLPRVAAARARFEPRARPQLPPSSRPADPPPTLDLATAEHRVRELVDHGAPRSPFAGDASDRFAYGAIDASDEERRLGNEAADRARAEIDRTVEASSAGTIDKTEAVRRIRQAYADRDQALDRIFGEDRADVLRDTPIVDGFEVPDDRDPD